MDFQNDSGYTPVILAACGGHEDLVAWLVAHGCSLDDRTDDGDSALLLSCYCGHKNLVEWILDHGGRLDERNKAGLTPLISAANGGHPHVVEGLIARGCDINETDNDGYSALLLAARRGYLSTVQTLALYGANLQARNKLSMDAIALAGDMVEVRDWIRYTRNLKPLHIAALLRSQSHIRRLLKEGADPFVRSTCERRLTVKAIAQDTTAPFAKPVCSKILRVLKQAHNPWTPSTHFLFGPRYRECVIRVMVVWRKCVLETNLPELPPEVWLHIISLVGRDIEYASHMFGATCDHGTQTPYFTPIPARITCV